ncbi:MAG TPA: antibiotic biosynthesis monooxygenase family protein [Acidimicrobiales bacterium]
MGVKVIVELKLQPGRRGEFVSQYGSLAEQHGSVMREAGWLGSEMFGVPGDPDKVIEIAEWESAEARDAVMQSDIMSVFAPLFEMMAAPFEATLIEPL